MRTAKGQDGILFPVPNGVVSPSKQQEIQYLSNDWNSLFKSILIPVVTGKIDS